MFNRPDLLSGILQWQKELRFTPIRWVLVFLPYSLLFCQPVFSNQKWEGSGMGEGRGVFQNSLPKRRFHDPKKDLRQIKFSPPFRILSFRIYVTSSRFTFDLKLFFSFFHASSRRLDIGGEKERGARSPWPYILISMSPSLLSWTWQL